MALASVVPVIWGIETGHAEAGEWAALSAECICWVALKGSYAQRLRILAVGVVLSLFFSFLGTITSQSFGWSVGCMLVVAFFASLFRNLGDRGSGLALSVYIIFLVTNAYPASGPALQQRMVYIVLGGFWNAALAVAGMLFLPEQQAYRRSISSIWRASSALMKKIAQGWDGRKLRSSARQIYLAEKAVRAAIDASFSVHERATHQLLGRQKEGGRYQLAQARKSVALVVACMTAIGSELEGLHINSVDEALRLRLSSLLESIAFAAERMAALLLSRRMDDELMMRDALQNLRKQMAVMEAALSDPSASEQVHLRRAVLLSGRCQRMMTRSMDLLSSTAEQRIYRAYPVLKTIYILHPRHLLTGLRALFSFDSHTARYATRTALAAAFATAIYKWWDIDHGYWLPFTVIIVMQPYFIATLRKGIDRLIGTVAGGIVGGLLIYLPPTLHIRELILFLSAVAMIHFFRLQYRISAFFITLHLVLLLSVSQELEKMLIVIRAAATLGGAIIAVAAGFLLLPNWDRKWLPRLMVKALTCNGAYFKFTLTRTPPEAQPAWTRSKRKAEVANANAYDSFTRALQEPGGLRHSFAGYFEVITHSIRITRELNNIQVEEEHKHEAPSLSKPESEALIRECATLFKEVLEQASGLDPSPAMRPFSWDDSESLPALNALQMLYLSRLRTELRFLLEDLKELPKSAEWVQGAAAPSAILPSRP